ncbi:hypothetical protein O181_021087 [Austropuccinia psidii MF-1]|uniref:Uncharacterized protein n=1 Tax=Austropuccinia psidii MF-1 TaxID=1389203 RepID=A0A9Q3CCX0_9BASI|nr:hypothetical protein [Austropuccinia psidii MF-1]
MVKKSTWLINPLANSQVLPPLSPLPTNSIAKIFPVCQETSNISFPTFNLPFLLLHPIHLPLHHPPLHIPDHHQLQPVSSTGMEEDRFPLPFPAAQFFQRRDNFPVRVTREEPNVGNESQDAVARLFRDGLNTK